MSGPIISPGWVGRIIDGRFALHEFLGESATSCVFRTELPQPVTKSAAIKLIAADGARADAYLAHWAKAANLLHPYLMRVFRSGRFQFGAIQLVYVVTEYAEEVLSQILPQRALTPDETREMLGPVIDALAYVHGKGFVHGHVKPSNVLVVEDQVKLSGDDLAASGIRNRFDAVTAYDAPEVSAGALTPAADVWSLGMLLCEALTQRTATWNRNSTRDAQLPEGLPRAFAEVARGCLRRDPESRISLREIQASLTPNHPIAFPTSKAEKVAERQAEKTAPAAIDPTASERVMEAAEMSGPQPTKMRMLPLVSVVAVVLILFALFMMRSGPKKEPGSLQAPAAASTERAPEKPVPSEAAPSLAVPGVPGPSKTGPGRTRPDEGAPDKTGPDKAGPTSSKLTRPATDAAREDGAILQRRMPEVSAQARHTIRGTVRVAVRVEVDGSGKVANASFESEGPSKYFAREALAAARGWTFTPASGAQAGTRRWVIHFKFRQSGDEATASEEEP